MEKNTVSESEAPQEQPTESANLTLREALEAAIEVNKDDTDGSKADGGGDRPLAGKAEAGSDAGGNNPTLPADKEAEPLQPPAEYSKEEREDFLNSTRKQQEAALRLHRSRQSRLQELKEAAETARKERAETDHVKRIADEIEPFVRALGIKEKPAVAIQKAVALWKQFEEGDPKAAAAAYLRAKGLPVPRELVSQQQEDPIESKVKPLQEEIDRLKQKEAQKEAHGHITALAREFNSFGQALNAAGKPRYPSIQGDEGNALSSRIGALVTGTDPFAQQFRQRILASKPDATLNDLFEAAYRWEGGHIDDSPAPTNPQSPQQHLLRSNRAASSVPGRGAPSSSSGVVRKFKTYREALEAAKAELEG